MTCFSVVLRSCPVGADDPSPTTLPRNWPLRDGGLSKRRLQTATTSQLSGSAFLRSRFMLGHKTSRTGLTSAAASISSGPAKTTTAICVNAESLFSPFGTFAIYGVLLTEPRLAILTHLLMLVYEWESTILKDICLLREITFRTLPSNPLTYPWCYNCTKLRFGIN